MALKFKAAMIWSGTILISAVVIASWVSLPSSRDGISNVVSPAIDYELSAVQIAKLKKAGVNGNCDAAYKIASYYANASLNFDEALKWARISSSCPEIPPKELLLSLLAQMQDQPAVRTEIQNVLSQVRKTDPIEADRLAASFIRR